MPKSSMRESILSRRYANHIALATSICKPSNCFEVRCDALMEENDAWVTVPFQGTMIDFNTTASLDLSITTLLEMHRENTSVCQNIFLVKREC